MSFPLLDIALIIDYALKRKKCALQASYLYSLDIINNIPLYFRESR